MKLRQYCVALASCLAVATVPISHAAADDDLFAQYQTVLDLFTGGAGTDAYTDGRYPALIAPAIRGTWAMFQTPEPLADPESLDTFIGGLCENGPTHVNPVAPATIIVERTNARTGNSVTYDYQYLIGATFTMRVDPFGLIAYLGLDRPGLEEVAARAVMDAQSDAAIYVVGPDAFVAVRAATIDFFFRCPGDDGVGNRNLAIEDALLRIVDGAFNLMDGALRTAYLDCGRKALELATREDLAALYRAINGADDASEAFAGDRPEIAEGLTACFEAADE